MIIPVTGYWVILIGNFRFVWYSVTGERRCCGKFPYLAFWMFILIQKVKHKKLTSHKAKKDFKENKKITLKAQNIYL